MVQDIKQDTDNEDEFSLILQSLGCDKLRDDELGLYMDDIVSGSPPSLSPLSPDHECTTTTHRCHINQLPDEMLVHIFQWVGTASIVTKVNR